MIKKKLGKKMRWNRPIPYRIRMRIYNTIRGLFCTQVGACSTVICLLFGPMKEGSLLFLKVEDMEAPVFKCAGELYAKKLGTFVENRLKSERAASIWTSTLQKSILTARDIGCFPKIQWRSVDKINAGVCDGMTYEEIKRNMPEEYE